MNTDELASITVRKNLLREVNFELETSTKSSLSLSKNNSCTDSCSGFRNDKNAINRGNSDSKCTLLAVNGTCELLIADIERFSVLKSPEAVMIVPFPSNTIKGSPVVNHTVSGEGISSKDLLSRTVSPSRDEIEIKCEEPELAFVDKKPFIPGFEEEDDEGNELSTREGVDFWRMVSGKSEEEFVREAEEEKEWLRCIEEKERKIAEEAKLKKLLEEVAKNEVSLENKRSPEDGEPERKIDETASPIITIDQRLIFDPSKVPEAGVIEPEYREAMGFVDISEMSRKSMSNKEDISDPAQKLSERKEVSDQETMINDAAISEQEINEKQKTIEELEAELVEEAKKSAKACTDTDSSIVDSNEQLMELGSDSQLVDDTSSLSQPITVQETKVDNSISVVYKIGMKKSMVLTGKMMSLKQKNRTVKTDSAKDEPVDKEADELERLAMQELLYEAKRGAERAREIGPLGWQKSRVPATNKRFLFNTLRETLREPFGRQHRCGRSQRGDLRRSRSRSYDRRRSRSRSNDRRRSRSRSWERRKTRSKSRELYHSRSRSREPRRSRSRSGERRRSDSRSRPGTCSRERSDSHGQRKRHRSRPQDSKRLSGDSGDSRKRSHTSKNSVEEEISVRGKRRVKKAMWKPSKCSWSSDEDDLDLDTTNSESVSILQTKSKGRSGCANDDAMASDSPVLDHPQHERVHTGKVAIATEKVDTSEKNTKQAEESRQADWKLDISQGDTDRSKGGEHLSEENKGKSITMVTEFEIKSTLETLDSIIREKSNEHSAEEAHFSNHDSVLKPASSCSSKLLDDASLSFELKNIVNEQGAYKSESDGANRGSVDDRTRRKLDIVESALREIEENPGGVFSDHEHRRKSVKNVEKKKKKKHKERKNQKHKSKHKRKRSRSK